MISKNINLTIDQETLIPIYYIDRYKDENIKQIFNQYKFKNARNNPYLLNLCVDICLGIVIENYYSINDHPNINILFTSPPSTMFYRKEKDIDSIGNLIFQVKKYLNFYFKIDDDFKNLIKYDFKNIFSINKKYLKNKKAQHIDGNKNTRIKDLHKRYYINFWNRRYLKKFFKKSQNKKYTNIICIVDDISSTGGTLLACTNSLREFIEKYNVEVELYSLAH